MSLSLLEAQSYISPEIATIILENINKAYNAYYENISDHSKIVCSPTTKANFINDHMVFFTRQLLAGHPDVQFVKRHGRTHLVICGICEVKFKKLNVNRRPSNILTQAVIDFNDQKPDLPSQLVFPGMLSKVTNLIAGYQQNKTKTGIEAVYVVCPYGNHNKWEWKLGFYEKPVKEFISLPTPMKPEKTVKPKRGVQEDATYRK